MQRLSVDLFEPARELHRRRPRARLRAPSCASHLARRGSLQEAQVGASRRACRVHDRPACVCRKREGKARQRRTVRGPLVRQPSNEEEREVGSTRSTCTRPCPRSTSCCRPSRACASTQHPAQRQPTTLRRPRRRRVLPADLRSPSPSASPARHPADTRALGQLCSQSREPGDAGHARRGHRDGQPGAGGPLAGDQRPVAAAVGPRDRVCDRAARRRPDGALDHPLLPGRRRRRRPASGKF